MKSKWDVVLTSTLVFCALLTTGLVVHREVSSPAAGPVPAPAQEPVFIETWRSELGKGVRLGSPNAPVQLIEFADLECPYCASFHTQLKALRDRYPTQVALSFVHYTLPGHRFAEPAARVVECADLQGRFEPMLGYLYEHQHQFGLKPWAEFATATGITDLQGFETCIQSKEPVQRIAEGKKLGESLHIRGTPTLIINGWMLAQIPGPQELERMVEAILAGKSPVN